MNKDADLFYFDNFDSILTPSYSWRSYVINTASNVNDLNIDKDEPPTPEGEKNLSLFLHEYIHYLQYTGTPWGIPVFTDLTLSFFKIGASKLNCHEKLVPKYSAEDYQGLLKDGLILRDQVKERVNRKDSFKPVNPLSKSFFISASANGGILEFSSNYLSCTVGAKIIREHMAHMGAQLFLGLSDEEIHSYNEKFSKDFSTKCEYWCLFEYFFCNYSNLKNIARGIFFIAQHCLSDIFPHEAITRFINWFETNPSRNNKGINLFDLFVEWLVKSGESVIISNSIAKSYSHSLNILELINKNKADNDLFVFSSNILNYCIRNYSQYLTGSSLFDYTFDFTSFPLWKTKLIQHGTCIIRYLDATLIHGTFGHCKLMEDSFNFLMSANNVLDKLEEDRIAMCPFQDDLPICTSPDKDASCNKNPFLHHNLHSSKQCLFRNGVILLGLEDRIDFGS